MKKKIAAIIIFIVVLVFPMVSWPMLFPLDNTKLNENRNPTPFPKFDNEFFINFDKFFTDHLPFRNDYIKLYSQIDMGINNLYQKMLASMGVPFYITKNEAIVGKEDWLFFEGEAGKSLAYYQAANLPSEEELAAMVESVEKVSNYFKSQGKEFVFYIAPNKEQVYSEYMPNGIHVRSEVKRVDMIVDYFHKHSDVKILYPKEELLEAKKERQIYYKHDTHWNEAGGYYGSLPLLEALGITPGEVTFTEKEVTGGDLADMIASGEKHDTAYEVKYRPEIEVTGPEIDLTPEIIKGKVHCSSTNTNGKNLFVLGDSFRVSMIEVLAKEYTTSNFYSCIWFPGDDYCQEEIEQADTIVFETVERGEQGFFDLINEFIRIYNL